MLMAFAVPAGAVGIDLPDDLLQQVARTYGPAARARLLDLQTLIRSAAEDDEPARLQRVNSFFNRARYVDDSELWGRSDYWATPLEFLARNGGDCEDFGIAKYFTLRAMGVPESRLRLLYVKALPTDRAHMVLEYRADADAEPLILDNLTDAIQPAAARRELLPVYSFNRDALWLAQGTTAVRVGDATGIGLWQELAARMAGEHFLHDL